MVIAATSAHAKELLWGVILVAFGLIHLVWRRYYARRNAAVETAKRETAIDPIRRHWVGLTSERGNLVWEVVVSGLMLLVGVVLLAVGLS